MAKAVEATRSVFIAGTKDYPKQVIKRGMKFAADDKRVKNNPSHFADVEDLVEAATAAPGEKREVKPRKRRSDTNAQNKKKVAKKPAAKKAQVEAHDKAVAEQTEKQREAGEKALVE